MSINRRLARPMLAPIFISGGIDTLRNPEPRIKLGEEVALKVAAKLGLPRDAELLIKVNAATQVGAGVLLAMGKFRRLSAMILVASLVPTTMAGHRFWELADPDEREKQRTQFFKNLGLIGGLVLEIFDHDRSWSFHPKKGESTRLVAAMPFGHGPRDGDET